jgi:nitroreductase
METIECIKTRASVREFSNEEVYDNIISELIEAATQAPSAGNTQEWHFIVVRKPENKKRVGEACLGQDFVATAPVIIVVCADMDKIEKAYGERGVSLYAYQDTAAAVENFMLAACEKGLGTCWVGAFNEAKLKAALVIPTTVKPVAVIPFGYPANKPKKPTRRPITEIIHKELWSER